MITIRASKATTDTMMMIFFFLLRAIDLEFLNLTVQ